MLFESLRELLLNVVKHAEVNRRLDLICRETDDRSRSSFAITAVASSRHKW